MGLLDEAHSRCDNQQMAIVSKDTGSQAKHIVVNNCRKYVRQYKLDGDVFNNERSCDFLVLNDTDKDAYFIELKGRHTEIAISQLEETYKKLKTEVIGYRDLYRLVASRINTLGIKSSKFRKFQKTYRDRFKYGTGIIRENI